MANIDWRVTRRAFLQLSGLAACGLAARPAWARAADQPLITKAIPATGEQLPVIGLGTNNFSVEAADEMAQRRDVLKRLTASGCRVVDTAPAYGRSEVVLGELIGRLDARKSIFLATKVTTRDADGAEGRDMIKASFDRLQTDRIDLMQVHNLLGTDALWPVLEAMKASEKIRYIGITTSRDEQHTDMLALMKKYPFDFIQVNFSIEDLGAADRILPLAADKGIAVLINMPFGGRRGGNLFARSRGHELPAWAQAVGITSWAQYLLKYVVSHPAVTCAIPGTHRAEHAVDNFAAAHGVLPDPRLREQMAAHWRDL